MASGKYKCYIRGGQNRIQWDAIQMSQPALFATTGGEGKAPVLVKLLFW